MVTASTASELRRIVNEATMMFPRRGPTTKTENIESPELTLSLSRALTLFDSDRGVPLTRQFVFSGNLALMRCQGVSVSQCQLACDLQYRVCITAVVICLA